APASNPAPILNSVQPTSGPTDGGTDVILTGNNFVQGLTLVIGARQATIMSVAATQIMARTKPGDAGSRRFNVTNPDGQEAVLKSGFTYVGGNPTNGVTLLTPNGGEVLSAGGLPFTINWMQMSSPSATQMLELSTDSGQTFSTVIAQGLTPDRTSFVYNVPSD